METTVFETYFERQFLKLIKPNRTVLLIYDVYSALVSIRLVEQAVESNVTVSKLSSL